MWAVCSFYFRLVPAKEKSNRLVQLRPRIRTKRKENSRKVETFSHLRCQHAWHRLHYKSSRCLPFRRTTYACVHTGNTRNESYVEIPLRVYDISELLWTLLILNRTVHWIPRTVSEVVSASSAANRCDAIFENADSLGCGAIESGRRSRASCVKRLLMLTATIRFI